MDVIACAAPAPARRRSGPRGLTGGPRLALRAVALVMVARPAAAQLITTEQGFTIAGATSGPGCAALPTIDARTDLAGPFATLAASGRAGLTESESPRTVGILEASLHTPSWRGWRLAADATAASSGDLACDMVANRHEAGVDASLRQGARGFWLGYRWRGASASLYPPNPRGFAAGAWQSLGDLTVSVSVGAQPDTGTRATYRSREELRPDSAFNDTLKIWEPRVHNVTLVDTTFSSVGRSAVESRARLNWARDRWSAAGTLGMVWRARGTGTAVWGVLEGAFALTPRVALTGAFVATPQRGLLEFPGRGVASLGVRVLAAPGRRSPATPDRAPPRAFEARQLGGDEVMLSLRAPGARYVEISGDFTAWRARRMVPRSDGWWEFPVRLARGRYHVNIRVDGSRWTAPPGLPATQDEFGGTVGILLVR